MACFRPADTAEAIKLLLWKEFELSRLCAGWMPAVPRFGCKAKLARLQYIHSRDMKLLHGRANELPGGLPAKAWVPEAVRELYASASLAPSVAAFFAGYGLLLEDLLQSYDKLGRDVDPILDAPTLDVLDIAGLKRRELAWVREQTREFLATEDGAASSLPDWERYVARLLELGKELGRDGSVPPALRWPAPFPAEPVGPVPVQSALDPRFPPYVFTEGKKPYEDPDASPLYDSVKQMHYINATEMSAAENLAYMYYAVQHFPLEFYYDLSRHLWDESRHAAMGVRRLRQLGYPTERFRYFVGGPGKDVGAEWYADMYASLTMVAEPCSFLKKRKSIPAFEAFGDELSAAHVEFDMADEQMHVNFGKKWGPELFKTYKNDLVTAQELAAKARLRRLQARGLTAEEEQAVLKDFPAFCGFTTNELNYEKY
ncbi:hypothetical protein [Paenibacillus sp.]|uniref:hypothetical protein n=1 Tax=Paenibacillus sp. TaxID=58172 RepID=UPI002D527142|nr:hypothetical protein [Paenibacillus sp.]HZG56009.1 hypothetical protein [Paenibacillus sp.]